PHAGVLGEPHAKHLGERHAGQVAHHLGDHGTGLRAPEVEPGDEVAFPTHAPGPGLHSPDPARLRRTTTCPAKRASSSAYGRPFAARSCATSDTPRITSGPASRRSSTRRGPNSRSTSPRASSRAPVMVWNSHGSTERTSAST